MTGSFVGGYISSGMGRVRTMAFFGVPVTLSSIGIAYASYPLTIHIWSFIQGLGDIVWMTTGSKFLAIHCIHSSKRVLNTILFQLSTYVK